VIIIFFKFIKATNLWVDCSTQHYLCYARPFTRDVRTKLQKKKGKKSSNIIPKDLHCYYDTILITSSSTHGFLKRNLCVSKFEKMPSNHGKASTLNNPNMNFLKTYFLNYHVFLIYVAFSSTNFSPQGFFKHSHSIENLASLGYWRWLASRSPM
jgi:hypothetical protein